MTGPTFWKGRLGSKQERSPSAAAGCVTPFLPTRFRAQCHNGSQKFRWCPKGAHNFTQWDAPISHFLRAPRATQRCFGWRPRAPQKQPKCFQRDLRESKRVAVNAWKHPETSKIDVKSMPRTDKRFCAIRSGSILGVILHQLCGPRARSPTRTKA